MNRQDVMLRLRSLVLRKQVERDLADELGFHIEMQTRKNMAAGMNAREAAARARIEFGGPAQVEEQCRDARRIGLIETTGRDIHYAIRGFRRAPALVATVVATIALGIGVVTALFTVLDAFYLRPLAVRDPQSLYQIFWVDRAGHGRDFTQAQYGELLEQNPALSEALAYRNVEARLDGRNVSGVLVSPDYFRMLGVGAARGRTLGPGDSPAPGREAVVVLSDSAWRRRFAGDPLVVGEKILLRGHPFEVVGVAPHGFNGLGERPTDFWAPLSMSEVLARDVPGEQEELGIVARLAPDSSLRRARAGVTAWAQRFTEGAPGDGQAMTSVFTPRGTAKPFQPKNAVMFTLVMMAFGVVLLIGCTNVANMMLARALARRREIGVRLSLGATRARLVRQLLTESLLLALPAAAVGLALSQGIVQISIRVLLATLPPGIAEFSARVPDLPVDVRVMVFGLLAGVAAAVLFGLAPALEATRGGLMAATRGDSALGLRPSRVRHLLVSGQVAVCVLLLVTASMLLRGVRRIATLDAGLSARDNVAMTIEERFRARVLERLSTDPAIAMLAAAGNAPVDRQTLIPITPAEGGTTVRMASNQVSPEYFPLFEIPIVSGRNFTPQEGRAQAGVAIVSRAAAQRFWPGENVLGRSLRLGAEGRIATIVGVARDETSRFVMSGDESTMVYTPASAETAGVRLFVHPRGDAEVERRKLDADLSAVDANAVVEIHKLQIQAWVTEDTYTFHVLYWILSAIGGAALLLTLSGIYGVMSYAVSQRTREIGIRMAMGATSGAVARLVLRQSMRVAVGGALAGGVAALGLSKILASAMAMIDTFDRVAYVGGVVLVLAACAAAAWFPSRRAAGIDPLTTLRQD